GRIVQAHEREADGGLAGPGFAHEPQRLALRELEAHIPHRGNGALAEEAFLEEERLVERLHLEDDRIGRRGAARALLELRLHRGLDEVVEERQGAGGAGRAWA